MGFGGLIREEIYEDLPRMPHQASCYFAVWGPDARPQLRTDLIWQVALARKAATLLVMSYALLKRQKVS